MANSEKQLCILLPSDVDIEDSFVRKVKNYFDVDLKFSTEELSEENLKFGIWFNLFGNYDNAIRARKYIMAAKGSGENTTNYIFDLPENFLLPPISLEDIEKYSCTHLIPSSNEIIITANDVADSGIAISLLEQEVNRCQMPPINSEKSLIFLEDDIIEEQIQNSSEGEDFVSYNIKTNPEVTSSNKISHYNSTNSKISNNSLSNCLITPINKQLKHIDLDMQLKSNDDDIIDLESLMNRPNGQNIPNKFLSASEPPAKHHIKNTFNNNDHYFISKIDAYKSNLINPNKTNYQNDHFKNFAPINIAENDLKVPLSNGSIPLNLNNPDLICLSSSNSSLESFKVIDEAKTNCNFKPFKENDLRYIVIDGSNVAMTHGKHKIFSCRGIQIVVDYFVKRGHTGITVIVPQARRKTSNHSTSCPQILEILYKKNYLLFSPSREINGKCISSYDDRYILDIACKENAVVVSNDNYRDLYKEQRSDYKKIIEERILTYVFHGDDFMPPKDPLGKHGPELNDFLRHKKMNQMSKNERKKLKRKKKKVPTATLR